MKVYSDINAYFLNGTQPANDYANSFFIRKIAKEMDHMEPDGEFWEPHKRNFFEIAILQKSTTNIKIGNQNLNQLKNSLAVVSPFQVINYSKVPPNDDYGYIIYFNASIFTNLNQSYGLQNEFPFFKIHTIPIYQIAEEDFKGILPIAKELYKESRSTAQHNKEIVQSLLLILLYKVKRSTQNNKGMVTTNRYDAIMSRFEQLIFSSNNNFLTVNEYASQLNISPIYLTECVKNVTGKSAQKIIIDYKLLYAKTMLQQLDKSIAEIAYTLNFNETANFNQFFKRNTGMTATQFRNRNT